MAYQEYKAVGEIREPDAAPKYKGPVVITEVEVIESQYADKPPVIQLKLEAPELKTPVFDFIRMYWENPAFNYDTAEPGMKTAYNMNFARFKALNAAVDNAGPFNIGVVQGAKVYADIAPNSKDKTKLEVKRYDKVKTNGHSLGD